MSLGAGGDGAGRNGRCGMKAVLKVVVAWALSLLLLAACWPAKATEPAPLRWFDVSFGAVKWRIYRSNNCRRLPVGLHRRRRVQVHAKC